MFAAALITFREGLEATLIVGIMLGMLHKLGHTGRSRPVWIGVWVAAVVSVAVGLVLNALGVAFEGRGEQIFEGVAMLLAALVLTWMIFWMQRQGRHTQTDLESDVRRAVTTGSAWALFGLAFVAVVREGIETALFLTAAAFSATPAQTLAGGVLGLAVAVGLGWLIFAAGRRLNLSAFFRVTGILLILFAAGLLARGVHEFQEAALLPTLVEHVWNIKPILDEDYGLGAFLKTLFGYSSSPSLLEVIVYGAYLLVVGTVALRQRPGKGSAHPSSRLTPKSANGSVRKRSA
jgi:high-affinity iron transporter